MYPLHEDDRLLSPEAIIASVLTAEDADMQSDVAFDPELDRWAWRAAAANGFGESGSEWALTAW